MVYHITVSLAVGSRIEDKYCLMNYNGNKQQAEGLLEKHILKKDLLCIDCDPDKVNDGKKTSYIMRCKDICCIAVSEK